MFEVINALAGNWFFDSLFILITHTGIFFMVFDILFSRDRLLFVKSVVGYMFVYVIDLVINSFYYVDRPFVVQKVNLLINKIPDASFPSKHAMTAFFFAGLLFYRDRNYLWFLLAFFVAFSRVYVGVHWVTDVVVGSLIGLGIAYVSEKSLNKVKGDYVL